MKHPDTCTLAASFSLKPTVMQYTAPKDCIARSNELSLYRLDPSARKKLASFSSHGAVVYYTRWPDMYTLVLILLMKWGTVRRGAGKDGNNGADRAMKTGGDGRNLA